MTDNLCVTTVTSTDVRAYRCAGRFFILLGFLGTSVALLGGATEMQGPTPPNHQGSPVDSGKPAVSAKFEGSLDKVEVGSVGGWAWDASQPALAIKVDIYDGTTLLSTIVAQEFREDLKIAGKGNGKHAFNLALPTMLRDGRSHTISVRYADTTSELPGSPKTLLFPKP